MLLYTIDHVIVECKGLWQWRMASSGTLCRVALVIPDVSEDLSSSFIRETRIGELGSTLLVSLMKEALCSFETPALTWATRSNIPEEAILHCHCCENLKSYMVVTMMHIIFTITLCRLCPQSRILKIGECNVTETGSVSMFRWWQETSTMLDLSEYAHLNHWTNDWRE
jgi:hypothetical protein